MTTGARRVAFSDTQSLSTALRIAMRSELLDLHTALPGIVEDYDAATRRARVIPAIQVLLDDGGTVDRPPVTDVPVLFPSGGGLSLILPLAAGDPVWLLFSQRGLSQWKDTRQVGPPPLTPIFDLSDAVALAGFGPLLTTPASRTGAALQTDDGATAVVVEPNGAISIVADGPVTVRGDVVQVLSAGSVTLRGSQINMLTA